MSKSECPRRSDILIIGAGLSGINAAYRIHTHFPQHRYNIIEASEAIGGTWYTFRYPGLRADSDVYTYSYPWFPWTYASIRPDRATMLEYLHAAGHSFGMQQHLYLRYQLISADWSSKSHEWKLHVRHKGKTVYLFARFIIYATGIYSHAEARKAHIPGLHTFAGPIIHPQFWPDNLDYINKRIILIGSGATAMTLLPTLAATARSVTMIQRSPGYLIPLPAPKTRSRGTNWPWLSRCIFRIKRLLWLSILKDFFLLCCWFPRLMRLILIAIIRRHLPAHIPVDPHFTPDYAPWTQRPNVCFGGEIFTALKARRARIETGVIDRVDARGVHLRDGVYVAGDIIITATGLKLAFAGDVRISVNGAAIRLGEKLAWNMTMVQDVPNTGFVMGYAHTSWTLGADVRALLICRVIEEMGLQGVVPRFKKRNDKVDVRVERPIKLQSGYIKSQEKCLPRVTNWGPWRARTTYILDYLFARYGNIERGLQQLR